MTAPAKNPRISVVIPAFNEPPSVLRASLESVAQQTFDNFECLVVDESKVPESISACRDFCDRDPRFHHVRPKERLGLAGSLNLGIERACGEFIARFDSDDVCIRDRFQKQVDYLDRHPDIGVVGGSLELMDESGRSTSVRHYPADHRQIELQFCAKTAVAHPTVMIRRDLFDKFGGYDPTFRYAEDLDLWLRFLRNGVRFANLDEVLVRYRQQNTERNPEHWRYNLKARSRNLASRNRLRQLGGLVIIGAWSRVPTAIQRFIFARQVLRKL